MLSKSVDHSNSSVFDIWCQLQYFTYVLVSLIMITLDYMTNTRMKCPLQWYIGNLELLIGHVVSNSP